MSIEISLVDYGLGNLLSVRRMLEYCGARVCVVCRPEEVMAAERLVLPGVGAFAAGMRGLAQRGMVDAVREFSRSGRHLLGICLGMQLLMGVGEENGTHDGLAVLPGRVTAIPSVNPEGNCVKIPHIGWNALEYARDEAAWRGGILQNVRCGDFVYFVHSFHVVPDDGEKCVATVHYENIKLAAVVESDNIHGCQFHPEKSGPIGLRIIDAFLKL
ncbi:MAG: imidazole glycerol phosphate synthase subunit HisH [Desulfovibrio sp.]|jgi:glutamine amidotransferase|nr:imidazole glycerol phosphate synthase subunit HisH [Desulfovibrio sp.]